ncbi:MAG: hypothetical protein JWN48_1108 [Myxococcaceae bacterium]|nr:hypothetical protein [Myxococcaceae bacterium]
MPTSLGSGGRAGLGVGALPPGEPPTARTLRGPRAPTDVGRALMRWWLAQVALSRSGAGQQPSRHSPSETPAESLERGMKKVHEPQRPVRSRGMLTAEAAYHCARSACSGASSSSTTALEPVRLPEPAGGFIGPGPSWTVPSAGKKGESAYCLNQYQARLRCTSDG